jgi:hypothetical protein
MSQNLYFSFRILDFCLFLALFGIRSKSVLAFAARFLGSRLTSVVILIETSDFLSELWIFASFWPFLEFDRKEFSRLPHDSLVHD